MRLHIELTWIDHQTCRSKSSKSTHRSRTASQMLVCFFNWNTTWGFLKWGTSKSYISDWNCPLQKQVKNHLFWCKWNPPPARGSHLLDISAIGTIPLQIFYLGSQRVFVGPWIPWIMFQRFPLRKHQKPRLPEVVEDTNPFCRVVGGYVFRWAKPVDWWQR